MAFGQLRPSPNKPRFYGEYFNKKNQWFAKTFGRFFTKLSHPKKKSILDRTKFVPSAGIAIVFAELLTTVSPLSFLAVPIQ